MTNTDDKSDEKQQGFFSRLKKKFTGSGNNSEKTGRSLSLGLGSLGWLSGKKLDDELAEELEDQLLLADVGVETTSHIIHELRSRMRAANSINEALRSTLTDILTPRAEPLRIDADKRPYVILMVGVNGSGKTTTIGKLARHFKAEGHSVMLAAGDTFRAAAVEQLQTWGERNNVAVVSQGMGADPAAVIFDAIEAARTKGIDILLADTAGRLQNQDGLMRELQKIVRVAGKTDASAPHEKMLVLDSSLGQNALSQAIQFNEAIGLSGITMTKLDGGAKGGTLVALANRLDVPFRFIGTGEQADNLEKFDVGGFIDTLLASDQTETKNTTDKE
ncbi:MAG: signal recognition particle-docking protein FtsY [Gammaproteobacteria bacterium]|jgi:fused signal recognition particle receptor|nr:signal recognition particle-docking protein FtsY [Gammaproteobacteria bacterium]